MPIRQRSPIVQSAIFTLWPIVVSVPITMPVLAGWSTELSCTLLRSPTRIGAARASSRQPYQTLAAAATVTRPCISAVLAMNAVGSMVGAESLPAQSPAAAALRVRSAARRLATSSADSTRTGRAGRPAYSVFAVSSLRGNTTLPASSTTASASTEPSSTTASSSITQPSPTVQACTIAFAPTVT